MCIIKKLARLGIAAALEPVRLLSTVGINALAVYNNSGDGPHFPGFALAKPMFAHTDPAAHTLFGNEAGPSAFAQLPAKNRHQDGPGQAHAGVAC